MNTDRHAICRREQAAWILSRAAVRANARRPGCTRVAQPGRVRSV